MRYTLFTLPNCPRCTILKEKLDASELEYCVNEDPAAAEEYADCFWPLLVDENGTVYEFTAAIKLCN